MRDPIKGAHRVQYRDCLMFVKTSIADDEIRHDFIHRNPSGIVVV